MSVLVKTFFSLRHRCCKRAVLRLCVASGHVSSVSPVSQKTFAPPHLEHAWLRQCRRFGSAVAVKSVKEAEEKSDIPEVMEITAMHHIFEKSAFYKDTIFMPPMAKQMVTDEDAREILNLDWETLSTTEKLSALKKLSHHRMNNGTPFSQHDYQQVVQSFSNTVHEFEYNQLEKLMRYTIPLHELLSYNTAGRLEDKICERYLSLYTKLSPKQLLLMADMLYHHKLWTSKLMKYTLTKLGGKPQKLGPKQLIQLLFYISVCGRNEVNMYELEYHLGECINEISVNELGIALRAFFKNSTQIKSTQVLDDIINKTIVNMKDVESVFLASIVKNLRYSIKPHLHQNFHRLLSTIAPETPRLSLMCLTHIAQFATKQYTYDETLMKQILERFYNEMSSCRMKDIERILLAMVMICPDSVIKHVLEKLVNELVTTYKTSRQSELKMHPISFMRAVLYLSYKNIYVPELLDHVFSPQNVQGLCKYRTLEVWRELVTIEYNVKVEFPAYKGPWMKDGLREVALSAIIREYERTLGRTKSRSMINEMVEKCEQLYKFFPYVGYTMPHYASQNIVIAFDQEDKPVPVSHILSKIPDREIKYVNTDEHKHLKWVAICPISYSHVVIGTDDYTSLMHKRFRQLKCIGYMPLPINYTAWMSRSTHEKTDYLHDLVQKVLTSTENAK